MRQFGSGRSGWSATLAVLVTVLVVTAGCQAVPGGSGVSERTDPESPTTGTPATTASTTDAGTTRATRQIDVEGGTLPLDQNAVWRRVAAMLDVNVGPPSTIRLANLSSSLPVAQSPFEDALGVPPSNRTGAAGSTPLSGDGGVVKLHRQLTDDERQLEATLSHEYVHAVQMRTRAYEGAARTVGDGDALTPDEWAAFRGVIEGAAEYVETRYARQELGFDGDPVRTQYRTATTTTKRLTAPYHFGAAYVNATVDGPSELDAIYENPPRTTEELLHGLEPGTEPPAGLSVSLAADCRVEQSGPHGELYVRALFGTALDEPAAARLADGWGNDTRLRFGSQNETERGDFAWVLRWDDAANATEFERGVEEYLDARDPEASVRVDRVAPETTVLFLGTDSFVAGASASGENATVTVAT